MNKVSLGLLFVVTCAISCASAIAAPIHDAVRNLDFAKVETFIAQKGNINLPEEVTGNTPLMIAVQKALPKAEELKNYPFTKETFMFIKKALKCGINTGAKQLATRLLEDPNGDILEDLTQDTDNKAKIESICDEKGVCEQFVVTQHKTYTRCDEKGICENLELYVEPTKPQIPTEPKEVDASCPTQDEVAAFVAQVKKDAPNSITAVTDIASAGLDFLFDMAFYDVSAQEPELKMIKLLREHNAQVTADMKQNVQTAQADLFRKSDNEAFQSLVRLGMDIVLFGLEVAVSSYAQSYPAVNKLARWPMNGIYLYTAVKTLIDARNLAVSGFSHLSSNTKADKVIQALA